MFFTDARVKLFWWNDPFGQIVDFAKPLRWQTDKSPERHRYSNAV
jgi:hypothetical protein